MSEKTKMIPQEVLRGALGPLLVGTWVNALLFTLEIIQVYRYFAMYPLFQSRSTDNTSSVRRSDPPWVRILVLGMFLLDIVSSGVGCAMAYTVRPALFKYARNNRSDTDFMVVFGFRLGKR